MDASAQGGVAGEKDTCKRANAPRVDRRASPPRLCENRRLYLIAIGLMGEPVPPVMMSGGAQKKNS